MDTTETLNFLKIHKEERSTDLHKEFKRIAKYLFEQLVIIKNGETKYCLTDIEFYLLASWHQDFYTYGKEPQKSIGKWFYHSSGIDFTFGDEIQNNYGGILIRGIIEMKNYRPINGCWNVFKELSDKHTIIDKIGFITEGLSYSISKFRELKEELLFKKRKGLNPDNFKKNSEKFDPKIFSIENNIDIQDYLSRSYRFFI